MIPGILQQQKTSFAMEADFVNKVYKVDGKVVDFHDLFEFSRASSKWVWGTGEDTGKLVEVLGDYDAQQLIYPSTLDGGSADYPINSNTNYATQGAGFGPFTNSIVLRQAASFLQGESFVRARVPLELYDETKTYTLSFSFINMMVTYLRAS